MPELAYAEVDRSETQTIRRKPSFALPGPVIEIHADRLSRVGSRACDGVTDRRASVTGHRHHRQISQVNRLTIHGAIHPAAFKEP
jgi:hypothetical protein